MSLLDLTAWQEIWANGIWHKHLAVAEVLGDVETSRQATSIGCPLFC